MQVGVIIPNAGPKTSAENIVATAPLAFRLNMILRSLGARSANGSLRK